jgi:hypothetical protein
VELTNQRRGIGFAAWNRSATGLAEDLAAGLRGLPVVAQAAALAALAAGIGWAIYRAWKAGPFVQTAPAVGATSEDEVTSRQ